MRWLLILGTFLSFLVARSDEAAVPPTQCVTTAVAGGTADALTVPTLPCVPTTTLLLITLTATNATTTPTLKAGSAAPMVILRSSGAPIAPGDLSSGSRVIMGSNGINWFLYATDFRAQGFGTVPNNAALQSLGVSGATSGVTPIQRLGFSSPGDGGSATYYWTSSACTLNSGAGDNGAQVKPNSGSGCWIAVLSDCPALPIWGGLGNNTVDVAGPLAAALTAQSSTPCVYLPRGKYKVLSAVSYTYPADKVALALRGDGPDLTELTWPNAVGFGLTINLVGISNHFHIRDMSFSTGQTILDEGLKVVQTATCGGCASGEIMSDLTNVLFRSSEGVWEETGPTITHGWKVGAHFLNVSFVKFDGVQGFGPTPPGGNPYQISSGGGSGVVIEGNNVSVLPVVFNFTNSNFQWLSNGVAVGDLVQGTTFSQTNFTANYAGVAVPPGNTGLDQLAISTGQFNNQFDLQILTTVPNLQVSNSLFITSPGHTATKAAINYPEPQDLTTITSNTFDGAGSSDLNNAIILNGSGVNDLAAGIVDANVMVGWANGIILGSGAVGDRVGLGNVYKSNAANIVNSNPLNILYSVGQAFANVSNVTNNGSGFVRLTLATPTVQFLTGEVVSISGLGGVPTANVVTTVTFVDSTHLDLPSVVYTGATYTGGGIVSAVP